jgi:methylated-DNA-[protein]-cysteine S-methyltransferase
MTTVPATLDARFRAAARDAGLVDVAYDLVDSPVGTLLLAATQRGLCRVSFDPEPEREEERLARAFGVRVLRAPLDEPKRELDEYFAGRRRSFELPVDLALARDFGRAVLAELARVPFGRTTTYGALAARAGRPRAARAVGTIMNRNPVPIVLPCHRVVGSTGALVGYGGGLERKVTLLRHEGVLVSDAPPAERVPLPLL